VLRAALGGTTPANFAVINKFSGRDMERALLPEGRAAAAPRPTALAAAAPLPTVLATVSALGRLLLPSLGFKASAWIGKAVALRCLGALPAPEKGYALAAYGLADVACSCMGRTAYYCATDALTTFAAQAYGARQHAAVGAVAQRAFAVILIGLYLPVVVLWCFARPILATLGQPHEVVSRAATYGGARTRLLVFALANAVLLRSLNAIRRPLPAVLSCSTQHPILKRIRLQRNNHNSTAYVSNTTPNTQQHPCAT